MNTSNQAIRCSVVLLPMLLSGLVGCSMTTDVSVKPVFNTYDKIAIWTRLSRTQEELFIPLYMKEFPKQSLVERRDLEEIITEQDILPDRLDDKTRAEIRRIYGVKAIVFPNYTAGCPNQLSVKGIDTETGEIVAAVLVTGQDLNANTGVSDTWLIRTAVSSLGRAALSCE